MSIVIQQLIIIFMTGSINGHSNFRWKPAKRGGFRSCQLTTLEDLRLKRGIKRNFVKKGLNVEMHAPRLELRGARYLEHNILVYSEKATKNG